MSKTVSMYAGDDTMALLNGDVDARSMGRAAVYAIHEYFKLLKLHRPKLTLQEWESLATSINQCIRELNAMPSLRRTIMSHSGVAGVQAWPDHVLNAAYHACCEMLRDKDWFSLPDDVIVRVIGRGSLASEDGDDADPV